MCFFFGRYYLISYNEAADQGLSKVLSFNIRTVMIFFRRAFTTEDRDIFDTSPSLSVYYGMNRSVNVASKGLFNCMCPLSDLVGVYMNLT